MDDETQRIEAVDRGRVATNPFVRSLGPGEILFREGDRDTRVFILVAGRIEIIRDGERVAEVDVSDSFIGEVSALTGKPRWATARTITPSTLLMVERIEELFKADVSWASKLARVLAQRLDRTNARLERLQTLLHETRSRNDTDVVETLKIAVQETLD